jgi:hypothetical protein
MAQPPAWELRSGDAKAWNTIWLTRARMYGSRVAAQENALLSKAWCARFLTLIQCGDFRRGRVDRCALNREAYKPLRALLTRPPQDGG